MYSNLILNLTEVFLFFSSFLTMQLFVHVLIAEEHVATYLTPKLLCAKLLLVVIDIQSCAHQLSIPS